MTAKARTVCELGHTQKAMECPSCSGSLDSAWWKWYRSRTSSKNVKAAIDRLMKARDAKPEGET